MNYKSIFRRACQSLVLVSLLGFGLAMAQAEPTLNQVYATAQSGKLDEAQAMIQQVLVAHPNSGKAHFVRAELFARQGKISLARESFASAEKLAPGLPFAKPEAVQALRAQLAGKPPARVINTQATSYAAPVAPTAPSSSWLLPLLLAGGVIIAGYFMFRRRAPAPVAQQPDYAYQGGLNGQQNFGIGSGVGQAANPQPTGYPQPGYPQQTAGSGLGGRIMGGLATGVAVGAGMMAVDAIGKSMMGNHGTAAANNLANNDYQPLTNSNPDMGGANFGLNDTSSWDDGGGSDIGGDWDN